MSMFGDDAWIEEEEKDMTGRLLLTNIAYECTYIIQVRPLSAGHTRNVHGQVYLTRLCLLIFIFFGG